MSIQRADKGLMQTVILSAAMLMSGSNVPAAEGSSARVLPEGFGLNIKLPVMNRQNWDRVAAAGFRLVRYEMHWHWIEKEKGVYTFDKPQNFDRLVKEANARGIRALLILTSGNELYCEKNAEGKVVSPHTPEQREAFARFAAAAAARYKGRDVIFELFNEPNYEKFWRMPDVPAVQTKEEGLELRARLWSEAAKVAVPVIRAANPGAIVIGPGISGPTFGAAFSPEGIYVTKDHSMRFLHIAAEAGALQLLDMISVHPYRNQWPETYLKEHKELQELLKKYQIARPIANSEQGWPVWWHWGAQGGKGAMSEHGSGLRWLTHDQQASYLVRNYLLSVFLEMPFAVWYLLPEESFAPQGHRTWRDGGFGLLDRKGQPKKAYHAAATMVAILGGYAFRERIPLAEPHDWLLRFEKEGAVIHVAYTEEGHPVRPTPRAVDLPVAFAKVFDLYGNPVAVESGKGFPLTNEPQYLLDAAAAARAPALEPQAALANPAALDIVSNGSFEDGLQGWQFHARDAEAKAAVDNAVAREGKQSVRLSNATPPGPGKYGWMFQDLGGLEPGQRYEISLWAKGEKVGRAFFGHFEQRKYLPEGDYDWREFTHTIKPDEKGTFRLILLVESETQALWIDDIRVRKVKP